MAQKLLKFDFLNFQLMKTKFIFFALLFLAFTTDSFSQYYGNGVDRSIGSGVRQNKPSKKNQQQKDYAEAVVEYLNKELKLDGLQQAAVKSIINDNKGTIEEISNSDISYEEKKDKILAVNDKIDNQILTILSKEQSEKYLKMKDEREKKAMRK